jgi:UDP-2,4-diacetamido-2,4,6-trideoxy-beta-L-altropyranose hydrolase
MELLILTEGGENIGFGHVTRCLSLCQAFEAKGREAAFFVNGDDSIKEILKDRNYDVFDWLHAETKILQLIKETGVVIVDSYFAGEHVYKKISSVAKAAVYLDDTQRIGYPPGIVVNWSICAPRMDYPRRDGVSYLLGPRYVSLRNAFWDVEEKEIKKDLESVMVTFGGDDSKNITPKVLNFLAGDYPRLRKNVVVGSAFKNLREIEAASDDNTRFIHSPGAEGMKQVMRESDIAVTSGGQTLYELARVGVPAVAVAVADNQRGNVNGWAETGFVENAGSWKDDHLMENLAARFRCFTDYNRRVRAAEAGRRLVPGNGADRIIDFVGNRIINYQ